MKKFIAGLALAATSMFGLVTCAPATPAAAAFPNDCGQVTYFAKRVCIDPDVPGFGAFLTVWNNNQLAEAYTLSLICRFADFTPRYAFPASVTNTFAGYASPSNNLTGYATTSPSAVPCVAGNLVWSVNYPAAIPGLNQKLLMGGYTFVAVGL